MDVLQLRKESNKAYFITFWNSAGFNLSRGLYHCCHRCQSALQRYIQHLAHIPISNTCTKLSFSMTSKSIFWSLASYSPHPVHDITIMYQTVPPRGIKVNCIYWVIRYVIILAMKKRRRARWMTSLVTEDPRYAFNGSFNVLLAISF